MDTIKRVLKWLSGKKTIISGLITTTSGFLVVKGIITVDDGAYINATSLILFGSASYATSQLIYKKKEDVSRNN